MSSNGPSNGKIDEFAKMCALGKKISLSNNKIDIIDNQRYYNSLKEYMLYPEKAQKFQKYADNLIDIFYNNMGIGISSGTSIIEIGPSTSIYGHCPDIFLQKQINKVVLELLFSCKWNNKYILSNRFGGGKGSYIYKILQENGLNSCDEKTAFDVVPSNIRTKEHRWSNDLNKTLVKNVYSNAVNIISKNIKEVFKYPVIKKIFLDKTFNNRDQFVLKTGDKIDNVIECHNFYGTLPNCKVLTYPDKINNIVFVGDNQVIIYFDNGWNLSFRVHTDGRIRKNPTLKVEVEAIHPEMTIWK